MPRRVWSRSSINTTLGRGGGRGFESVKGEVVVRVSKVEEKRRRTEIEGRTKRTAVKAHMHTGARVPCLHVSFLGSLFLLSLPSVAFRLMFVQ